MTDILYEHPLNERIRNYLKLESLSQQIKDALALDLSVSYNIYFNALFTVMDAIERNDIRGDLIKDLDKLEQNLMLWAQAPNIDKDALQRNLKLTISLNANLKAKEPLWLQLKQDKLLTSVRKRFAMQSGSCCSDLPQLHFWVAQGQDSMIADCERWYSLLSKLFDSLTLVLKFIRQRGDFDTIETHNGFYQNNGDGIVLLRIKTQLHDDFYPTVSGNKYRFSIRFASPCDEAGQKYLSKEISFELARC